MFLGVGMGNLINPAAIALTKANAFQAAKTVLGLNAATATCLAIAEKYTAWVLPQTNRALTVQQILGDVNFSRFVSEGQDSAAGHKSTVDKVESALESKYGLFDSLLFGIPNIAIYGGLGYLGYRYWKKRKAARGSATTAPLATAATAPLIASNPRRRRRNCGCRGIR